MFQAKKNNKLKKELRLLDVFAISTGTTLSGGLFLLPGLAAEEAGAAVILSYILAAVPLIPAMFSMVELATAMPRAGGIYYFLDRTLGPLTGTIGGIGTWLALILKVAFALIGMGAYISLFLAKLEIIPIAVALAVALGLLNLFSVKGSGKFQIFLVAGIIIILLGFMSGGIPQINPHNFKGFFDSGYAGIISAAGLVYVSYVGMTKVVSLSEEIKDPEKNLPRGIFLGIITTFIIYWISATVMVGVVPMEVLSGDLTPVATAANNIFGKVGVIFVSFAALMSFISVANAGIMSASRYPFAMSRDFIFPHFFQKLSKKGTPFVAILLTVATIILILLFLDPTKIAKLASAFLLLTFALVCLAVIVMRESKLEAYDPGYHSPMYPWIQIVGVLSALYLIFGMGAIAIGFTLGLIIIGAVWYKYYASSKIERTGAIYHVFERWGRLRYTGLDSELRGILKEKGLREEDPFDEIVTRSFVLDIISRSDFRAVVQEASKLLSQIVRRTEDDIASIFLEGTRIGMTPVINGIALPHFRTEGIDQAEMVLVRAKQGIHITFLNPLTDNNQEEDQIVYAIFFLVSPEKDPAQHLRILAQIAGRVEEDSFFNEWNEARDDQEIKEILLHDERFVSLFINSQHKSADLISKPLRDIKLPKGCLVAILRRNGLTIVPNGNTVVMDGDRITIIGDPSGLREIRNLYI